MKNETDTSKNLHNFSHDRSIILNLFSQLVSTWYLHKNDKNICKTIFLEFNSEGFGLSALHKNLSVDGVIHSFGASVAFYYKCCTCNTVFYGENNCNLDNFRGVKQYFPLKYKLAEGRSGKVRDS